MSRPRFRVRHVPHRREVDAARVAAWRDLARARTRARVGDDVPGPEEDPLLWCRWSWWPAPHDEPGPYEPTIVVHHGGSAGRCITYDLISVRDTPLFRTPAFWRRVRPGVLFQLDSYPNGWTGKPTRTHRTREHVRIGTWWPSDPAPDLPMGIGLPPPSVVEVEVPGVGRVVAELSTARPGEAPVYAVRLESMAAVRIAAEFTNVKAGKIR